MKVIELKNKFSIREIVNELHMQLFEAAYWWLHSFGNRVTHNTELDRRHGRAFADDVERELGSPNLNQINQREPSEEELEELFNLLEEEINEPDDS